MASFDSPLLKKFMWRWGFDLEEICGHHVIDTAIMAVDRYIDVPIPQLDKPSQSTLCKYFGIEVDEEQLHNPYYDAKMAATIYRAMKTGGKVDKDWAIRG